MKKEEIMKSISDYDILITILRDDKTIEEQVKATATSPNLTMLVDTYVVHGEHPQIRFLEVKTDDEGKVDFQTVRHVRIKQEDVDELNRSLREAGKFKESVKSTLHPI